VTDPRHARPPEPKTDLILDITLWVEIALLALVLLDWHPPIRPFPDIFPRSAPHTRQP
jgi:hypothetical protein